jgi:hypothetical protein
VDEKTTPVTVGGNAPAANFWSSVSATPAKTTFDLSGLKTVIKGVILEVVGQYDQSVSAETQATEGNLVLIQEIHMVLDGVTRRAMSAPVIYELDRIIFQGAMPQVDPATGVATGKVFSHKIWYPFGFLDKLLEGNPQTGRLEDQQAKTYLDLNNYTKAILEVIWNPFQAYVSGGTQANMNLTSIKATVIELIGLRIAKAKQRHFEMLLAQTPDMSVTANDRPFDLFRDKRLTRGVLLRSGKFAATPVVTDTTTLTNFGVKATRKDGLAVVLKDKTPVSTYQGLVAINRVGIQLRAGYVFADFASDQRFGGVVVGDLLSTFQGIFDSVGSAGYTMQMLQAAMLR